MNGATVVDQVQPLAKCQAAMKKMTVLAQDGVTSARRYHASAETLAILGVRDIAKIAASEVASAQSFAAQVAEAEALLARIAESNGPILIPGSRVVSKAEDGRSGGTLEDDFFNMDPAARAALLAKLAGKN